MLARAASKIHLAEILYYWRQFTLQIWELIDARDSSVISHAASF